MLTSFASCPFQVWVFHFALWLFAGKRVMWKEASGCHSLLGAVVGGQDKDIPDGGAAVLPISVRGDGMCSVLSRALAGLVSPTVALARALGLSA